MAKPALIETLHVPANGQIPLLPWHVRRLQRSCAALSYPLVLSDWLACLYQHIQPWPGHALRVRMLLSPCGQSSATSSPLLPLGQPLRVKMASSVLSANSYLAHKTTCRPWFEEAQTLLQNRPELFDVIFCDDQGWLLEGSRSNVYILDAGGSWLTPPLRKDAILPGVQRQALIDQGHVHEIPIHLEDWLGAKKIRVSNALRGWQDACLVQD